MPKKRYNAASSQAKITVPRRRRSLRKTTPGKTSSGPPSTLLSDAIALSTVSERQSLTHPANIFSTSSWSTSMTYLSLLASAASRVKAARSSRDTCSIANFRQPAIS